MKNVTKNEIDVLLSLNVTLPVLKRGHGYAYGSYSKVCPLDIQNKSSQLKQLQNLGQERASNQSFSQSISEFKGVVFKIYLSTVSKTAHYKCILDK